MPESPFEKYQPQDLRDLIGEFPLAWVRAANGEASLLPLIGLFDPAGRLEQLIGHFALSNPLHAALAEDRRASILFTGPQGYVSPSHAGRRNWGPTWTYAQARMEAEVSIEPDLTPEALDILIDHVERARPRPWSAEELGPRYDQLIGHIVGFRARVTSAKARFKLGQDEDLPTLRTILGKLEDPVLVRWMTRFNRARLAIG
jgi:transcriptional regulator